MFANPWLALGALAALIPVLVHLLQRRRPRPHAFAAMELLRRSQLREVRRLRLKRLLLLLARTAILLAIPLALARPQLASEAAAAQAAPRGPAATALVLDASMSMGHRTGGDEPLFERARADAREALANLGGEEPVTVQVCDGGAAVPAEPGFDRALARRQLDEARLTARPADLTACLAAAARALGASPLSGKRLLVFTDLTASAFRLEAPPPTVPTPQGEVRPEVVVVDAARGAALPNVAITDLQVLPATEVSPRAKAFRFTVRNHGPAALSDLVVELVVGDAVVAKSFLDLPASGAATKQLTYKFPRGGTFTGQLRLAADALPIDDTRAFVVQVPRDLRALVVNGAPSTVRFLDEAFFVDAALRMGGASPVEPTTVDAETLPSQDLALFDLVLLLNVRAPEAEVAGRLRAFVEGGGGLFVSLGDNVEAESFNERLGGLLPLPLHLPKSAGERGRDDVPAARFDAVELAHPVLAPFVGEGREGLLATRTYRYFLLQPGRAGGEAHVLASFDDGAPALVERPLGRGRVLLYTSTVDRDWSDWPIQTSFLPALQQAAAYLARSLEERRAADVLVGAPHPLEAPEGAGVEEVLGPDGEPRALTRAGGGPPRVEDTAQPGLYRVRGRGAGEETVRELPELAFAVRVDPRESDTTRLPPESLKAHLGGETTAVAGEPTTGARKQTPLWSVLLAFAVFAFFAEGVLVRR